MPDRFDITIRLNAGFFKIWYLIYPSDVDLAFSKALAMGDEHVDAVIVLSELHKTTFKFFLEEFPPLCNLF
jgi:hypothetical protein